VHAHVVVAGAHSHSSFVAAKLVRASAELGLLPHARAVASAVRHPNAFVWTALIRAHAQSDSPHSCREALLLYTRMLRGPKLVDPSLWFHVDPRVLTALLGFYAKCGRIVDARKLFDEMAREESVMCRFGILWSRICR
ncbi:Pentatricopeptide repeat-containing protein, partial [Ananas comosus]